MVIIGLIEKRTVLTESKGQSLLVIVMSYLESNRYGTGLETNSGDTAGSGTQNQNQRKSMEEIDLNAYFF